MKTACSALVFVMSVLDCSLVYSGDVPMAQLMISITQASGDLNLVDSVVIRFTELSTATVTQLEQPTVVSSREVSLGTEDRLEELLKNLSKLPISSVNADVGSFAVISFLNSDGVLLAAQVPVSSRGKLVLSKSAGRLFDELDYFFEVLPFGWGSHIRSVFNRSDPPGNGGVANPAGSKFPRDLWAPQGISRTELRKDIKVGAQSKEEQKAVQSKEE